MRKDNMVPTGELTRREILREFHQAAKLLECNLHEFRTMEFTLCEVWKMAGFIVHYGSYSDATLEATV
jgi:hypothetical protein